MNDIAFQYAMFVHKCRKKLDENEDLAKKAAEIVEWEYRNQTQHSPRVVQ